MPHNVMPLNLWRNNEACCASTWMERAFAKPGDDPKSRMVPRFMNRAVEALQVLEADPKKPGPVGLNEDLILESSLTSLFIAEVLKKTWFASVKSSNETLPEQIQKLKKNIGISPIYESAYTTRESYGAKYKPVARKVIPVSTQDPDAPIPQYKEILIGVLPDLPVVPPKLEKVKFMPWLS